MFDVVFSWLLVVIFFAGVYILAKSGVKFGNFFNSYNKAVAWLVVVIAANGVTAFAATVATESVPQQEKIIIDSPINFENKIEKTSVKIMMPVDDSQQA